MIVAFKHGSSALHVVRYDEVRDSDLSAVLGCSTAEAHGTGMPERHRLRGVFRAESFKEAQELLADPPVCKGCRTYLNVSP